MLINMNKYIHISCVIYTGIYFTQLLYNKEIICR